MAACLVGAAPPLWVNGKPDSTNPRKGCTAAVGALRPELFVVLARMQVRKWNSLASEVTERAMFLKGVTIFVFFPYPLKAHVQLGASA